MPKKSMIAVSVVAFAAFAYWFNFIGSEAELMERHFDLDPQLVIRAHREIFKETLQGKYQDAKYDDDDVLDAILRQKVASYTEQ